MYQVVVWQPGTPGSMILDKPSWLEMARCQTEWRAKEVAICLSLRHKYVAVALLNSHEHRFENYLYYPDEATVKQATTIDAEQEAKDAKVRTYNAEMDKRDHTIAESIDKPWLPLHDGE